jgi:hypothetical protein
MPILKTLNIFCSYAHADLKALQRLETHLAVISHRYPVNIWHDGQMLAGVPWEEQFNKYLNDANIVLLLVSSNYLTSAQIQELELPRIMERHRGEGVRVIPIILRPCFWEDTPFSGLTPLPSNGKPITSWANSDAAYTDVVRRIQPSIEDYFGDSQDHVDSTGNQTISYHQASHSSPSSSPASTAMFSPSGSSSQPSQANTLTEHASSATTTNLSSPLSLPQVISKEAVPDAMKVATDKAVRRLSEDKLGFAIWVKALRNFIVSPDTTTPLSIGIDGAWGTGKSSFMRMLQDLLEPSFSFGERWKEITWPWLWWFGMFLITFPVWMIGILISHRERNLQSVGRAWFQDIADGLTYDPEIDKDVDLQKLSQHKRFWAKIAAWHCPKQPVSNPTIWFNAWKFDQEEQLWAALALAVLDQMQKKYNFFQRIIFWIALEFKRFSWATALYYIFLKIALPIALGLLAWKFDVFLKVATGTYPKGSLSALPTILPLSQTLLWIGAGLSGIIQISSIVKDPFQISIKHVFDKPDYKEKIGFIGSFEEDFSSIVSLITRPTLGWKARKLIIFIDDLDRCKLPKAVDIIEGINLFLDSEQCIFIIGMDTTAVIASIETKYEGLFKQMQRERTEIVSAGRFFLDKIIQVPLQIPPSIEKSIDRLVEGITEHGVRPLQVHQVSTTVTSQGNSLAYSTSSRGSSTATSTGKLYRTGSLPGDSASYTHEEVRQAILEGARLLPENPRQVKRFINLFRLYVYVANEQNLFEEENQVGLTMNRLAIWVVWSLRWGDLVRHLSEEGSLLASESDLIALIAKMAKALEKDGDWKKVQTGLIEFNESREDLLLFINDMHAMEQHTPSHWSHLPWKRWFRDRDFLVCIKELEIFWSQPQPSKINWLQTMLLMTKITSNTVVAPASNESI